MYVVVLYVLPLLLSVEAITDLTITEWARGKDVVEDLVGMIQEKNLFGVVADMLILWARASSDNGWAPETFRPAFYGGIWQISEKQYNSTKYASLEHLTAIKKEFGIDWVATKWKDLLKPLYSGLAARLTIAMLAKKFPKDLETQAKVWSNITGLSAGTYGFTSSVVPRGVITEIRNGSTMSVWRGIKKYYTYEATTNCQTLSLDITDGEGIIYYGLGYQPNRAKFDYVVDTSGERKGVPAVIKRTGKIFITVTSFLFALRFKGHFHFYQNKCECPKEKFVRYVNEQLTLCMRVMDYSHDQAEKVAGRVEKFYTWTEHLDECHQMALSLNRGHAVVYYASKYQPTVDKYDYMAEIIVNPNGDEVLEEYMSERPGKIFITLVVYKELILVFHSRAWCDCDNGILRPIDSNFISCRFSHDLKNDTYISPVGMEKYYHYENTVNCTKLQISRREGKAMVYYGSNYPPNATKYDAWTVLNDNMVGVVVMKMTGKIYLNIINEELGFVGFHTSPGECSCPEGQSSWRGEMFDVCGSGPTGSPGTLVAILLSLALLIIIIVIIIICMRRRKNEERQATEVKLPDKCPSFCCFLVCCRRSAEKEDGRDKQ